METSKKVNSKDECYLLILHSIHLKNNLNSIEKYMEGRLKELGENFLDIIQFLKEKRFIIYIGKNWMDDFSVDWYKVSKRGMDLIGVCENE